MTPDDAAGTPAAVKAPKRGGGKGGRLPKAPDTHFVIDLPRSDSGWIADLLRARYGDDELAWVYESGQVPGATSVESFQKLPDDKKRSFRAVMGYFAWGVHRRPGPWFAYLMQLRDPVERAQALHRDYLDLVARRADAPAEPPSLDAFVFGQQHLTVDNGYVRAVAGRRHVRFGQCPDDLYEEAVDNIERRFAALLLHDEPARARRIVASIFGSTEIPEGSPADPGSEPAHAVAPDLRDRLRKLNRLDLRLLDYARERFDATYDRIIGDT